MRSLFLPLTFFLPVLLLIGCQEEGIETHRVPRVDAPEAKVRLLGAIIPHENDTWFVKLVGPLESIGAEKESFDAFLASFRFKDDAKEPLTWTLPAGWKTAQTKPLCYATLHIGKAGDEKPLEVTITQLGKDGDARSLSKNINRWRVKDLGLRAVGETELSDLLTTKPVGFVWDGKPVEATIVDMEGPGGKGGMQPPAALDGPAVPPGAPKLKYDLPPGWVEIPAPKGIVVTLAAFKVRDGDSVADVTITLAGGDLTTNINRWRMKDVGLPSQTPEEVKKEGKTLTVMGAPAHYVDLIAPGDNAERKRVLGVIQTRADMSLFFKMIGPADLVGKNKDAFEKFVGSVKFEGGNDG